MKPCSGEDHVDLRELHPPDRRVRTRGGGLRLVKNPKVVALFCGRCGYFKSARTGVVKMLGGGGQKGREASRVKPVASGAPDAVAPKSPPAMQTAAPNPPSTVEIGDGGGAAEEDVKARRMTPHEAPGEARGTPRRIPARGDQVALEAFVEVP